MSQEGRAPEKRKTAPEYGAVEITEIFFLRRHYPDQVTGSGPRRPISAEYAQHPFCSTEL